MTGALIRYKRMKTAGDIVVSRGRRLARARVNAAKAARMNGEGRSYELPGSTPI